MPADQQDLTDLRSLFFVIPCNSYITANRTFMQFCNRYHSVVWSYLLRGAIVQSKKVIVFLIFWMLFKLTLLLKFNLWHSISDIQIFCHFIFGISVYDIYFLTVHFLTFQFVLSVRPCQSISIPETKKHKVGVQQGQPCPMGRRCYSSLVLPHF